MHAHALRSPFRLALLAVAVFGGPAELRAQDEDPAPPPAPADSVSPDTARADTARAGLAPAGGVRAEQERNGPAPMGAFFRSVVLPGWGQYYADQPVRGIVYTAVHAANVFMIVRTQKRIDDAESDGLKEARRAQREDWLVFAGFWMLASGVDAWVSAQMWDFEGEVVPPPDGSAGVALELRVPLRGF